MYGERGRKQKDEGENRKTRLMHEEKEMQGDRQTEMDEGRASK